MFRYGNVGKQYPPHVIPLLDVALVFLFRSPHSQNVFYQNPLGLVNSFFEGVGLLLAFGRPPMVSKVQLFVKKRIALFTLKVFVDFPEMGSVLVRKNQLRRSISYLLQSPDLNLSRSRA
jgi:hypothetical protein